MHVLIVDDQLLFAQAVGRTLADMGIASVDVVDRPAAVWLSVEGRRPDLVLIEVDRADGGGVELARALVETLPRATVLALTTNLDAAAVRDGLVAGLHGCLSKDTDPEEFRDVLRRAAQGRRWLPADAPRPAAPSRQAPGGSRDALPAARLTAREHEVLQLLAEGSSNQEMAERLRLSPNTVRTHVQGILSKLQVHSRLEAAAFAVRHGMVRVPT